MLTSRPFGRHFLRERKKMPRASYYSPVVQQIDCVSPVREIDCITLAGGRLVNSMMVSWMLSTSIWTTGEVSADRYAGTIVAGVGDEKDETGQKPWCSHHLLALPPTVWINTAAAVVAPGGVRLGRADPTRGEGRGKGTIGLYGEQHGK